MKLLATVVHSLLKRYKEEREHKKEKGRQRLSEEGQELGPCALDLTASAIARLTALNGWVVRVDKVVLHKLNHQRGLPCEEEEGGEGTW